MAQNHFIHDLEAKPFPTRGHMPMFEQNFKKLYFQSMLTLFGPFLGPNRSKWPKIVISLILRPNDFQRGVTCLCLNKISENGIFCIFSISRHFPTIPDTFPDISRRSGAVGKCRCCSWEGTSLSLTFLDYSLSGA